MVGGAPLSISITPRITPPAFSFTLRSGVMGATTITQSKIKRHPSNPPPDSSRPSAENDDVAVVVQNVSGSRSAKPRKMLTNSRSIIKRRLVQTQTPVRLEESRSNGGIKIAKKRLSKSASFIKPVRVGVRTKSRFTKCSSNDSATAACFSEATCSSQFRSTAFPDGDESPQHLDMGITTSAGASSSKKVCPYKYCSLHGAGRPQLKRFGSIRRPGPSGTNYNSKPKVRIQNKASQLARDGENVLSNSNTAGPVTNRDIYEKENTTQGNPMSLRHQLSEAVEVTKDEKPREENEKTTRVWRLIYHSMLSAKYRSELYSQVNADSIPAPVQENSLQVKSEELPAVMPTFESSQMDAVKLVEDAIDELFLPELEEQVQNNQTGGTSERDAHESNLNDFSSIVDHCTIDSVKAKEVKPFSRVGSESMSKNWSKLKQIVLLKRFVKALDKLNDLKFKEPKFLNVDADPEMEKVRLRRQTTDEKRLADEWMLDYALRQAVAKLTPARRKKVELLIEAFESVIPLSENGTPQSDNKSLSSSTESSGHLFTEEIQPPSTPFEEVEREGTGVTHTAQKPSLILPKDTHELKGLPGSLLPQDRPPLPTARSLKHKLAEGGSGVLEKFVSNTESFHKLEHNQSSTVTGLISHYDNGFEHTKTKSISTSVRSVDLSYDNTETSCGTNVVSILNHQTVQEDPLRSDSAKQRDFDVQLDNQKYFKMWGMIYNHVVSGTAAKIGSDLHITESVDGREAMDSKLDAVKLVEDALDEMLLPEYHDQSSDEQSVTSDQDHLERMDSESVDSEISTPKDSVSFYFKDYHKMKAKASGEADVKACVATHTQEPNTADKTVSKTIRLRFNGWSNLKKFILLKRFIRAVDKLKKFNPRPPNYLSLEPDQEPEKVSLKHQTSADRLSAEQWMIDNAIQQVVARLTPARKRRVELLVEAFETVETVLPSPSTRTPLKHSWPSAPHAKHF